MPPRDYIHEIQTTRRHGLGPMATWIRRQVGRLPDEVKRGPVRHARVEHGRWLIDCPDCGGAVLGDPEDPRVFCPDCQNAMHGGAWLPVEFPRDIKAIEQELLKRPIVNRNWLPSESLKDLRDENKARGVAQVKEPTPETAFARLS